MPYNGLQEWSWCTWWSEIKDSDLLKNKSKKIQKENLTEVHRTPCRQNPYQ